MTTTTQVVCELPAHNIEESLQVKVFVDNQRIGTCANCYWYYSYWNTPQIEYMIPNAASPASGVNFFGRQRVGSTSEIDYLKIGSLRCDKSDYTQLSELAFNTWDRTPIPCDIPSDHEAGYYTVSQRNTKATGMAKRLNSLPVYKDSTTTYDFAVVPRIDKISSNSGSYVGQILTIQGAGFSKSGQNSINFGDTSCIILSQNEREIVCELQQRAANPSTQGYHSGLKLEYFDSATSISTIKSGSVTPTSTQSRLNSDTPMN